MTRARKLAILVGGGLALLIGALGAAWLPRFLTWRELDRTYVERFPAPPTLAPSLDGKRVLFHMKTGLAQDDSQICVGFNVILAAIEAGADLTVLFDAGAFRHHGGGVQARRSPEIHLGPNLSHFMYRLGLTPVTGKRGTTHRLRDQLHRLFSTTLRWTYSDEHRGRTSGRGYVIAGEDHLWWSPQDRARQPRWPSRVVLGREFFDEITTSPVPVDLRASPPSPSRTR